MDKLEQDGREEILQAWVQKLLKAFEMDDLKVDIHAVLNVAGVAAHQVIRPAAPLTTYIAGLAAGLAAGSGQADDEAAMAMALGLAKQLAAAESPREPAQ